MDKEKILAGRRLIDDNMAARALDTEVGHQSIIKKLEADVKALGFRSIDDVFVVSYSATVADVSACLKRVSQCDNCQGRTKMCHPGCFANARKLKGKSLSEFSNQDPDRILHCMNYWKDHWAPHLPLRVGDVFPQLPGCSKLLEVVKEPELDWTWDMKSPIYHRRT